MAAAQCNRLLGKSIIGCNCMLPNWGEHEGGWLPCPAEARGILRKRQAKQMQPIGDCCADCGGFTMVRTGTCMTCSNCGSTSGGCS